MILILSIILCFGNGIFWTIFNYLKGIHWALSLLIGVGAFVVMLALYCLFLIIYVIIVGYVLQNTNNPNGTYRNKLIRDISHFCLFWANIHYHVKGLEKIPQDQNYVIVANHQSLFDVLILFALIKEPYSMVFKDSFLKNRLIGPMAKSLGGLPIYRENNYKTAEIIVQVIRNVKKGQSLLIFPEGKRSKGPHMRSFRAGAFKIPLKAKVPVVAIAHDGSYRSRFRLPFLPTHVYLNVVDVISPEQFENLTSQELSHHVHSLIENDIIEARKVHKYLKIPRFYRPNRHKDDPTNNDESLL